MSEDLRNTGTTENPWMIKSGSLRGCVWGTAYDRLDKIKSSNDPVWLKQVIAWPDNQKTVQQAAERRLKKIATSSQPRALRLHDWEFITNNERRPEHRYTILDAAAKSICDVYAQEWKNGKVQDDPQALANARLILAAPQLLRSCQRLLKLVIDMTPGVRKIAFQDYRELNEAPIAAKIAIHSAIHGKETIKT